MIIVLLNLAPVQTYLSQKAAGYLSDRLGTRVAVKNVRFSLGGSLSLEGLFLADKHGDTLLYAKDARIKALPLFSFVRRPEIKSFRLYHAYVYLRREADSDSWNYQFVIDAFAGKPHSTKDSAASWPEWQVRKVELADVKLHSLDRWVGTDMLGEADHFVLEMDRIDYKNKRAHITSLFGDGLLWGMREYKGGRPPGARPPQPDVPTVDTVPFNPQGWALSLGKLSINRGRFFLDYPESKAPDGLFDADHIDIKDISLRARDISVSGDTLQGRLTALSAKERCGLEIVDMSARVTVSPVLSECRDLKLKTANSDLGDYYAMRYRRFPDFLDYIEKVTMEGHLKNARVHMRDIAFFAPELLRFKDKAVTLSGKGKGTVDALKVDDYTLTEGASRFSGSLYMRGLPDWEHTYMEFERAQLSGLGSELYGYAPELKKDTLIDLSALGPFRLTGSYSGYPSDFRLNASLVSAAGNLATDIHMLFRPNEEPRYLGSIATDGLDIAALTPQSIIGPLTMTAHVRGTGFRASSASVDMDGHLSSVAVNAYSYKDLSVKGTLARRKFDGHLLANDPNIQLELEGMLDFSGQEPVIDAQAQLKWADFKALGWTEENIRGSAKGKVAFKGSNIDNFIGDASISELEMLRDTVPLNIHDLSLSSQLKDNGDKHLALSSSGVRAVVDGRFSLMGLPGSVQVFLSYYLPQYVKRPDKVDLEQKLDFEVQVEEGAKDLLSLADRHLDIAPGSRFQGTLDMKERLMAVQADLPYLAYKNLRFHNVAIKGLGGNTGLNLDVMVNGIKAGATDLVSTLQFQSTVFQDSARFQVYTTTPSSVGSAEVYGLAYARSDSFMLHLLPSEFYVFKDRWQIEPGNKWVFSKGNTYIERLSLKSGDQKITVNDPLQEAPRPNTLNVRAQGLDAGILNEWFGWKDAPLSAKADVSLTLSDMHGAPTLGFALHGREVTVNDIPLGDLDVFGQYAFKGGMLRLDEGSAFSSKGSKVSFKGTYDFAPADKEPSLGMQLSFSRARLDWASPFLKDYVSDMKGNLDGELLVRGEIAGFNAAGKLDLTDASFRPLITGVHYHIDEATIGVAGNKFELANVKVRDDEDRTGLISGQVLQDKAGKASFRLNMRSDNIQVLDLTEHENPDFYGKVKASVQLRLSGPFDNLNLNIFATPQKGSHLYIPIGYGGDVGDYDYITFRQYSDAPARKVENKNKLNIRIDAVVTPDLESTLIIDPATGDQIWSKGSGNIIWEMPADGEMKMNGNYVIEEGKYDFSFKQLQILNYKRQFTIEPNSIIKWNGDIADADLDVSAYAQVKARLYDLIMNEVDRIGLTYKEIRDVQVLQMVNVGMNMKGSLREPQFKFKLDLVENRSVGTYAYQKLQRINSDEKELLNQVASLLLLEQFVPPEGLNSSSTVASGTINNLSELFSSAASSQITNFANKILGMEDLYVGVKYKNYSLSSYDQLNRLDNFNRNEAGINLRKSFLKNRLVVEVGGVYDWGRNSASSDLTTNVVGDFRVQYLLTDEGRVRVNFFRASDYDAIGSQTISRQGVGLSYRKSFDRISDIFKKQRAARPASEELIRRNLHDAAPKADTLTVPGS